VAFENDSYPGYCTEKVLHAFSAGCIPIYWGDPNMTTKTQVDALNHAELADFNPKALISAHDFESLEELVEHIVHVDSDFKLYESYLKQPLFSEHWYSKLKDWNKFQVSLTNTLVCGCEDFKTNRKHAGSASLNEEHSEDDQDRIWR